MIIIISIVILWRALAVRECRVEFDRSAPTPISGTAIKCIDNGASALFAHNGISNDACSTLGLAPIMKPKFMRAH